MLRGMLVQPCFKQTEIGEIPEDWNVVKIGDVGTLSSGSTPSRDNPSYFCRVGGHAWVKTMNLTDSDVSETDERITDLALKQTSCRLNPPKTVMIAMYGGFNQIGRTGVLRIEAATNQAICCINVDQNKLDPDYCNTWLVANRWRWKNIAASSRKDPNITKEDVRAFPIVLPPLAEQKKIAEILSSVDEAITSTQAVINQTRKVKQGLLQQLLTRGIGHTKFKESAIGKIPEGWNVVSLQEMGKPNWFVIRSGPFGSSLKTEHFRLEGEPVLTIQSLGEGEILKDGLFYVDAEKAKELSEYRVQPGDLVFSRVADIGRSVVITENEKNCLISSNLMRISVNQEKYNPWFIMYSIVGGGPVTRQIEKLSGTTGRPVVSSTMMKQIAFAIPPLDEQYALAMRIQQTEEVIRQEGLAVDRLVALKNGLMQDLLTGRVHVK